MEDIRHGDNLALLGALADGCVQMVYADPPFNTGRTQTRQTLATAAAESGDRTGFGGRRYATTMLATSSFADAFEDYLGFLEPRLRELRRVLRPTGTLYLHLDYREAHHVKLLLDELFGRECFLNELIWAYDYGGKPKRRWPQKHEGLVRRFVHASSRPRDLVLDPFAGSGTLGAVAAATGRRFLLMDSSPDAVRVMRDRLEGGGG